MTLKMFLELLASDRIEVLVENHDCMPLIQGQACEVMRDADILMDHTIQKIGVYSDVNGALLIITLREMEDK